MVGELSKVTFRRPYDQRTGDHLGGGPRSVFGGLCEIEGFALLVKQTYGGKDCDYHVVM